MFILICLRHVRAERGYCLRHIRARPERIAQCDDAGLGTNLPEIIFGYRSMAARNCKHL